MAVSSDLDGDSLTLSYTWTVDGSIVQTGSTDTLASTEFVKNNVVEVSVEAFDGNDNSSAVSTSVTVSNTPPTAPSLLLDPSAPVAQTDDLICSVDTASLDIDSDTVTYSFAWTVDGADYTSASSTATTSTVPAADTNSTEEWECTVTPNDGEADGSSASISVTTEADWGIGSTDSFVWDNGWELKCTDWSGSICRGMQIYVPTNECVDDGWWNLNFWHGADADNACDLFCDAMGLSVVQCHYGMSPNSGTDPGRRLVDLGESGCTANFPSGSQLVNNSGNTQNLSVTCSW